MPKKRRESTAARLIHVRCRIGGAADYEQTHTVQMINESRAIAEFRNELAVMLERADNLGLYLAATSIAHALDGLEAPPIASPAP